MNKKGVEMTMQTVVIALLVLLVLGVLIFLLFGGVTSWTTGTACNSPSYCVDQNQACNSGDTTTPWKCSGENQKCCSLIGK